MIGLAIALAGSGCSFSLRGPDPDRRVDEAPSCSTSKGLVVMDGLATAALGITAISAGANSEPELAAVAAIAGVIFAAAAVRGSNRVDDCRSAESEHQAWIAGRTNQRREAPVDPYESEPSESSEPSVSAAPPVTPTQLRPQTSSEPAAVPPATPPAQQSTPKSEDSDDDAWSDFWEEVP